MTPVIKICLCFFILYNTHCSFAQSNAAAIQKRWVAVDVVGDKAKKEKYGKLFARHATEMELKDDKFFSYQDGVLQGAAPYSMAPDGKSLIVKENGKTQISLKIISLDAQTLNAVMYGFLSNKDTIIYKVAGSAAIKEVSKERASASWIEVGTKWNAVNAEFQRKYDLISALVKTVKASEGFNQDVLNNLDRARSNASSIKIGTDDLNAANIKKFMFAKQELNNALSAFWTATADYPDIKSNKNIQNLQTQLEGTENRIAAGQQEYNVAVMNYGNSSVKEDRAKIREIMLLAEAGSEKSPKVGFPN